MTGVQLLVIVCLLSFLGLAIADGLVQISVGNNS